MKPIRILHVLGSLNHGGVENWLLQTLSAFDREHFKFEFLVGRTEPGVLEQQFESLGCKIHRISGHRNIPKFKRRVRAFLEERPTFDAIHSHSYLNSGIVLSVAKECGISVRVSHSHNCISRSSIINFPRYIYESYCSNLIKRYSTHCIGITNDACESLFGKEWAHSPKTFVLYYGLDFSRFTRPNAIGRDFYAEELRLRPEDLVIGHVGSFTTQKNHLFFLQIAKKVLESAPNAKFVFVGDGPLKAVITREASRLGLYDHCRFLGLRNDVPELMRTIFDCFVLPSLYEGLGIVIVEAQAAGLPTVFSDHLPRESIVFPDLVRTLPLKATPREWANGLLEHFASTPKQIVSPERLQCTNFSIENCVTRLSAIYSSGRSDYCSAGE